jgi:hypothetical protein
MTQLMVGLQKTVYVWVLYSALAMLSFSSCSSSERCLQKKDPEFVTGQNGPRRIYVPEYYLYRRGKYEFVPGHYRLVLSRKTYLKRSMRGYTYRREHASIR